MRQFDYREKWKELLTPEIVNYLSQIHEFKGEQTLFLEAKADTVPLYSLLPIRVLYSHSRKSLKLFGAWKVIAAIQVFPM